MWRDLSYTRVQVGIVSQVSVLEMDGDVVVHLCDDLLKKIIMYSLAISFVSHSFSQCSYMAYVAQEHAKIPGSREDN